VWALDKPVKIKNIDIPTCLSTVVINNGKKPFPVGGQHGPDARSSV